MSANVIKQLLLVAFLVQILLKSTHGFYISIEAHGEECFFENVVKGAKLGISFEVAEGGFLDIDVRIMSPDGKVIHQGERESNGRYTFPAAMDGTYTYCFSNKMSTMTPKIIMFNIDVTDPGQEHEKGKDGAEEGEDGTKLESMIRELSTSLMGIKHEQDYMSVRDKNHRAINDDTNSKVVMWSFFEALVLIAMTIGQIYYLKQFFEVKRVV